MSGDRVVPIVSASERLEDAPDRPPSDDDAERDALGAVLVHPEFVGTLVDHVTVDSFRRDHHQTIFRAIASLHAEGIPPELLAIRGRLQDSGKLEDVGLPRLTALVDGPYPRTADVLARLCQRLVTLHRARRAYYHALELRTSISRHPHEADRVIAAHIERLSADLRDESRTATKLPDLWEAGPAFLARAQALPDARMLIDELLPADGLTLNHGDPRTFKTWLQLAAGIGLTTGRPVCGHCRVPIAVPVGYVTNEDGVRRVADRLHALLRGLGPDQLPEAFHFAVHRGVWLDDLEWQKRLIVTVKERGIRVLMLDPLRSLSACVDQGPRELQPFATWLRFFQEETGCAVWMNHHNTKPMPGQKDDRRRPYRASGGGLFSIADAPILLERIGDTNRAIVTPSGWKFAEDPPPLEIQLTVEGDTARLDAGPAETTDAADAVLQGAILTFLAANPGASGRAVRQAVKANRENVTAALQGLCDADQVDCVKGKRGDQWFIRRT